MTWLCTVFLASLALLFAANGSIVNLDYRVVRLVDVSANGGNLLFRGNMPQLNSTAFAYDLLVEYMQKRATEAGVKFPQQFKIIDVSFLQPDISPDEAAALALEQTYWQQNADQGSLLWWEINGDASSPYNFSETERRDLAVTLPTWQPDQIVERVDEIYQLLQSSDSLPLVIYFHCGHGEDRTGEFAGAYYLRYLGWSWNQTWAYNSALDMDEPPNVNGLMWYCSFLQDSNARPLDCTNVQAADIERSPIE